VVPAIGYEVANALELKTIFGFGLGKPWLNPALGEGL
jgi:hypothetical protein